MEMEENKNEIFQALADKLDEKEFKYDPAHWQAAQKLIPSSTNFWSPKWITGIGATILVTGIVTYNLVINNNETEQNAIAQNIETVKIEPITAPVIDEITIENDAIIVSKEENIKTVSHASNKEEYSTDLPIHKKEKEKLVEKVKEQNTYTDTEIIDKKTYTDNKEEITTSLTKEEYKDYINSTGEIPMKRIAGKVNREYKNEEEIKDETEELNIEVPNVFTPNGDGKNDYFTIKNLEGKNWSLQIYNQRNELVYESKEYNNAWNGGELKQARYLYKLYNSNTEEEYRGSFELKR